MSLSLFVCWLWFMLCAARSHAVAAQQPAAKPEKSAHLKLPFTNFRCGRVVLYKSGVGYFRTRWPVYGNQDVEIDLTSASSTTC